MTVMIFKLWSNFNMTVLTCERWLTLSLYISFRLAFALHTSRDISKTLAVQWKRALLGERSPRRSGLHRKIIHNRGEFGSWSVWLCVIHKELIKSNKGNKDRFGNIRGRCGSSRSKKEGESGYHWQMKGSVHADDSSNCILQTLVTANLPNFISLPPVWPGATFH